MSTIKIAGQMFLFILLVGLLWLFIQFLPAPTPVEKCPDGTYNCYEYSEF